jgi:2-oxoglutarate dehydrogenase E2 component (dihydrolipoamide succinyltransferase)
MAIDLKVPSVGESITEVEIGQWLKAEGDSVEKDENIVVIESEKATLELPAPATGTLVKISYKKGDTVKVGESIGQIEEGKSAGKKAAPVKAPAATPAPAAPAPVETKAKVMPAAERVLAERGLRAEDVKPTGPGGRLLKEDVLRQGEAAPVAPKAEAPAAAKPVSSPSSTSSAVRREEAVRMTPLRRTLAKRLVEAQHNAALLTTFNEIDMSAVMAMRQKFQESFQARYGVKLGFMSFFIKATVDALKLIPQLNAEVRGTDIVYRNYHDMGIAVSSEKGLAVPVLRNADLLSFAEIESAIADFGRRAKENKLRIDELEGGTFTITNGGIFGSLLSTPIVNPPQSGVLGMHSITERPVAREGQVVIRPMMYVALTYDHRIVDGREAVTFLKRVKENIEEPARMLIEV